MNKAIFLDRDGTINIDTGYVHKIEDFKFIDRSITALKKLYDLGYLLIIITNQSGIGRGYYTNEDFNKLNNYMLSEFEKNGIHISKVYYCPHVSEDKCECRKPNLKLFYDAKKEFDIDFSKSYAIGDNERDLCICFKENVKGILLTKNNSENFICKNDLLDCVNYIIGEDVLK